MILDQIEGVAQYALNDCHVTVKAVKLNTFTDKCDNLTELVSRQVYNGSLETLNGQIFIFDLHGSEKTVDIIIPAPDCVLPELSVKDGTAYISGFGVPVYAIEGKYGCGERIMRDWYRTQYSCMGLHAMSNTWGDRNGRTRVNDEFIRREIESGADLGLDVVQIDDGWQKGVPDVFDECGLRMFEGDFWELKTDIFPRGMRSLSDYAKEKGTELGLWFAPHSRGVFEHFERDTSVLEKAYNEWNMRYFKLDMVQLPTHEHCAEMRRFLDRVLSLGEGVSVELDVTADKRLGYLYSAPYGTIFVENRYTAWGNYYPHRTLRNLWMLSRYVPTQKLQMELVNTDLFTDAYPPQDPFRHELYDIDYLFACVMLSNPLFWMETQFLSSENRSKLKSLISLWKEYRDELSSADVYPIGEEPSGRSMTGFVADCGKKAHLILIREASDTESFTFDAGLELIDHRIVAANTEVELSADRSKINVSFGKERAYVWIEAKIVK